MKQVNFFALMIITKRNMCCIVSVANACHCGPFVSRMRHYCFDYSIGFVDAHGGQETLGEYPLNVNL